MSVSHISVIGYIWQPTEYPCAMDYSLSEYDLSNLGEGCTVLGRDDVEYWLSKNGGDFREIIDFSACIGHNGITYDFPWDSDESEMTYSDCMYGDED